MKQPRQPVLDPGALGDQILAMIQQQRSLARRPLERRGRQRVDASSSAASATASASIVSLLPTAREPRRRPAINFGATLTTRSPRASRNRSSLPDTCRQSSIAQTRCRSNRRAHPSMRPCPAVVAETVSQLRSSPVPEADRRTELTGG
jgi:hypothetical protein